MLEQTKSPAISCRISHLIKLIQLSLSRYIGKYIEGCECGVKPPISLWLPDLMIGLVIAEDPLIARRAARAVSLVRGSPCNCDL